VVLPGQSATESGRALPIRILIRPRSGSCPGKNEPFYGMIHTGILVIKVLHNTLMPLSISFLIPNVTDFLALEVEEAAGVLLMHLNSYDDGGAELNHHMFFDTVRNVPYPEHHDKVSLALMEAWDWLASAGFIARKPDAVGARFFVTRRGQRLKSREDFSAYRKASMLPEAQLHPLLARVYPAFLRGEYDTAVFQAFREVEVAVRQAGSFPNDMVGVHLMREAFKPTKNANPAGPLTDPLLPIAEQEGMASLFVGAISVYKNPQSHRHASPQPEEATEIIMFASQLLRLVDTQRFRVMCELGPPIESVEEF